ncbi:MAG: histidine kinase [Lachnospiraceae bacterium]|nr:histidine kinase [Lachnospiraceae bacterium]
MVLFVILPLSVALISLNTYLQRIIWENRIMHNSAAILQIRDNIDQVTEMINYSVSALMLNQEVLHALRTVNIPEDSYESWQAKNTLSKRILELESSAFNMIDGKVVLLTDGGYFIGSSHLGQGGLNFQDENWYRSIIENGSHVTFRPDLSLVFRTMYPSSTIEDYQYLYSGRSIQDYSGKNLGILVTELSAAQFWETYTESLELSDQGMMYILDTDRKILMKYNEGEKGGEEIAEEAKIWKLERDKISSGMMKNGYYYMAIPLRTSGNILVYTIPRKNILAESRNVTLGILCSVLILVVFTTVTMFFFSRKLSKPLIYVINTIENSPNGITRISQPKYSYLEVNKLIFSYNQATQRIEELIERVKAESQLKEKAHYDMLMSQISPHFMFNTVNSVRIMAKEHGDERTERALEALGEILHGVYSNNNGMTTIGQEAVILQAYVDIMKMRFGDFFQYYNGIPTELYFYEIPAFTIQPLVENAILHGIKDVQAGQIIISAMEYERDLMISVFDNGISADKELMKKLLHSSEKNKSSFTGIALYNVNERLKILYGESYGLILNDQIKSGFEILIRIPKKVKALQED